MTHYKTGLRRTISLSWSLSNTANITKDEFMINCTAFKHNENLQREDRTSPLAMATFTCPLLLTFLDFLLPHPSDSNLAKGIFGSTLDLVISTKLRIK